MPGAADDSITPGSVLTLPSRPPHR